MSNVQVFTPLLPYVGRLPAEQRYGSRIKFKGHFREPHDTVHVVLQREALLNPHEDVPLYITIHPGRREIVRNHLGTGGCPPDGQPERVPNCPIECGQDFELSIVASPAGYELLLQGAPFHTFGYRVPLAAARFLFVSSGCILFAIHYENWNVTAASAEQSYRPQLPSAPPLQLPTGLLYPTLEQPPRAHQQQQHQQQSRAVVPHQQPSQQPHIAELMLQVWPLVQLAAAQLQANNSSHNAGLEALSQLLPLFQPAAKPVAKARRLSRCAFWRSCAGRMSACEVIPAAVLTCSFGVMRILRFLVVAGVFGYIGYVFSRNT